jgi:hypothetical protein
MQPVPYMNKPILNARDAIASHIRWKITLLTAARMREPLSERATRSIEHPDECSIRQWLLSAAGSAVQQWPEYSAALDKHMQFHRTMQRIARLLNRGDHADAERQLSEHGGEFERHSLELANALMAFERARQQRLAS